MSDTEQQSNLRIGITSPTQVNGEPLRILLDYRIFLPIFRMGTRYGPTGRSDALVLAAFGGSMALQIRQSLDERRHQADKLTEDETKQIWTVIQEIWKATEAHFRDDEEAVLDITYRALRDGIYNRGDAAIFASQMLGRNLSSEAWRKRVDRWADNKKLDPVEQPRGRPKKK